MRFPASVPAREFCLGTQCSKLEVFCRLLLQRTECCCSRAPLSEDEEPRAYGRCHDVRIKATNFLLYADFFPQDGQLTLVEQLRNVITEHIP